MRLVASGLEINNHKQNHEECFKIKTNNTNDFARNFNIELVT